MEGLIKVFYLFIFVSKINTESNEYLQQAYSHNSFYAPYTLNFNDIYTNDIIPAAAIPEESHSTTEDQFLNTIQTQFVEFRPDVMTMAPLTVPPPKYILNATFAKENEPTTTTTTEDPEEEIKVVPIKRNYQRGVLDLLFPSARVKNFKSIFDSVRRILSHTFKR